MSKPRVIDIISAIFAQLSTHPKEETPKSDQSRLCKYPLPGCRIENVQGEEEEK